MAKVNGFIAGSFDGARFTEESLKTDVDDFEPLKGRRLQTQTTTGFEFGHPEQGKTDHFFVIVKFSASVNTLESESALCTYSCKVAAQFLLLGISGFEKWEDMPPEAPVPYFSFVHFLVRQRALDHFRASGFGSIKLPVPEQFKNLNFERSGSSRVIPPPQV